MPHRRLGGAWRGARPAQVCPERVPQGVNVHRPAALVPLRDARRRKVAVLYGAVAADAVLIVTDHKAVDYKLLGQQARLIVDTRNAMAKHAGGAVRARVVKA